MRYIVFGVQVVVVDVEVDGLEVVLDELVGLVGAINLACKLEWSHNKMSSLIISISSATNRLIGANYAECVKDLD